MSDRENKIGAKTSVSRTEVQKEPGNTKEAEIIDTKKVKPKCQKIPSFQNILEK